MDKKIDKYNLPNYLSAFLNSNNISSKKVSKSIGCSQSTFERILNKESFATEKFLKQAAILMELGFKRYKKLSSSEKEKISETIGTISGAGVGFASITSAVSVLGYAGLSAAGITSGLAAIGGIVGGGMAVGIVSVAAFPIVAGAMGYGIVRGVKHIFTDYKLKNTELDLIWELPNENFKKEISTNNKNKIDVQ